MKKTISILFILPIIITIGCSSTREVGSEIIVDKSGSTPSWVLTPTQDDADFIFVTGEVTKANDRSFGMNQAYADGVGKVMNTMQNAVSTETAQAFEGANLSDGDLGRYTKIGVAWISDTYKISGVQNPEVYWEKVEVKTNTGVKYNYNCYSLLKISRADYNRALEGAFYEMQKKAQEENNKKAEQTTKEMLDRLKSKQN